MKTGKQVMFTSLLIMMILVPVLGAVAQDDTEDQFYMELNREMEQLGWDTSVTGELVRALNTHRFQNLEGVDPEMVAFALQYALRNSGEDLEIPAITKIAARVMTMAGEMNALGFEERDVLRSALNGVREMVTARTRNRTGESASDEALQTREQIRLQIREASEDQLKTQTRSRIRTSNPHDPDQWTPPGPAGSPGSGNPSGPLGPGGSPGTPSGGEMGTPNAPQGT